jgi:hypothetical protein
MSLNSVSLSQMMGSVYLNRSVFIQVQLLLEPREPDEIIKNIAWIKGAVDLYCWYEGKKGLPVQGARFMTDAIFIKLFEQKKDVQLKLYSLKSWNFNTGVKEMAFTSCLGNALNQRGMQAVECVYAASFFRYCEQLKSGRVYSFVHEQLPRKEWLIELSQGQKQCGWRVADLFDNQASLFDCIADSDLSNAYAQMQYVEAYYLIQRSVRNALSKGQQKINIAFVLPNDEGRYYRDLPQDIPKMLELEFGAALKGVEIAIAFHFFRYTESLDSRPYIDKAKKAKWVQPQDVNSYFSFMAPASAVFVPRDIIHKLND